MNYGYSDVEKQLLAVSKPFNCIDIEVLKNCMIKYVIKKLNYLPANMNENVNIETNVYFSEVRKIIGGNLCASDRNIYIDKQAFMQNTKLYTFQITHEMFHSLSFNYEYFNCKFGQKTEKKMIAINEGVTQLLTEDFKACRLSEEDDRVYFYIKLVMRVFKVLLEEKFLMEQYFNVNDNFEKKFNYFFKNNFECFNDCMNEILDLKTKNSRNLMTHEDEIKLDYLICGMNKFMKQAIKKSVEVWNHNVIEQRIIQEVQDKKFLNKIGYDVDSFDNPVRIFKK